MPSNSTRIQQTILKNPCNQKTSPISDEIFRAFRHLISNGTSNRLHFILIDYLVKKILIRIGTWKFQLTDFQLTDFIWPRLQHICVLSKVK